MRERAPDRDFCVAIVLLLEGYAIARRCWADVCGPPELLPPAYIQFDPERRLIGVWRGSPARTREYRLSGVDLLGTDWRPVPASELLTRERGRIRC